VDGALGMDTSANHHAMADWRVSEKTKGDLFGKFKRETRNRHRNGLDCFQTCMKKFAWDVDEVPLCTSKCAA
jgi:hypothetical protein